MAIAVTNYPTALDDAVSLVLAANAAETTLNGAHNNSVTTFTVASTALFPSSGIFLVDTELISYTGKTATTFTGCVRGFEGTSAASHSTGAAVKFVLTAQMWQALVNAVIALETKLGIGVDTVANGEFLAGAGAGVSGFRVLVSGDIPSLDTAKITTGTFGTSRIANDAITNALLNNVPTATFKGRTTAGTGDPEDLTVAQATALLNTFTTTLKGLVPAPGSSSGLFLKDDGTWAAPAGSGDMVLASAQTVTGAKSFNDGTLKIVGGNYGTTDGSLPAVVARSFLFNLDSGRLFYGKGDGSAWAEVYLSGVSKLSEFLGWALSDETTTITTGLKLTDRMPYAFNVTGVKASLTTASSSGVVTLNVKKNGTSIFTTKVTIDANEETSVTAATPSVLTSNPLAFADDDEITFEIDTAGTGATGLKVKLLGYR